MASASGMELRPLHDLQTKEQMQLLDIVDDLRAQGLSEFTALPQLIVCGDQSSGKSSVLEAISGVPFPRQDDLCTRFATEVILRRAASDGISVSIVAAKEKSPAERERLQQFSHALVTQDDFPALFKKAKDAMGISDTGKGFSRDILRVEIRGPTQPQVTLVDLPGLIHSETMSQTAQDVEMVKSLVGEYMAYSRSIILAVVSAKNDIGNQIVLRRAREVDPEGKRTLGIITKPDTLPKDSGSEKTFLRLARNNDVKFDLGWHVVRNLDTGIQDNSAKPRDEQERAYFRESNFKNLRPDSVGIAALRVKLSKILFNQIRVELPSLVKDIESKLSSNESELAKLGPSRISEHEQRSFLTDLSTRFQEICRDAIRGDYDHPFFQNDSNHEKRLCAVIMNMHFAFADELRKNGARWKITDGDLHIDGWRTRSEAIKEACKLLKKNRGRELAGLPNPRLVGTLFREYSSPWEGLARRHIQAVWHATNEFLGLVLRYLSDDDVSNAVQRFWLDAVMEEKLKAAYTKLNDLTAIHQDAPMTFNHGFLDSVKRRQQKPFGKEELVNKLMTDIERCDKEHAKGRRTDTEPGVHVYLTASQMRSVLSAARPDVNVDMDTAAAAEAVDNMQAFYEVAVRLFIDNVPSQAIQGPIIRELPSTFGPMVVCSMTADSVMRIAGESEEKRTHREELLRKKRTLEAGAQMCKQYVLHPNSDAQIRHGSSEESLERNAASTSIQSEDSRSDESASQSSSVSPPASTLSSSPGLSGSGPRPNDTEDDANKGYQIPAELMEKYRLEMELAAENPPPPSDDDDL